MRTQCRPGLWRGLPLGLRVWLATPLALWIALSIPIVCPHGPMALFDPASSGHPGMGIEHRHDDIASQAHAPDGVPLAIAAPLTAVAPCSLALPSRDTAVPAFALGGALLPHRAALPAPALVATVSADGGGLVPDRAHTPQDPPPRSPLGAAPFPACLG